MTKVIEKNVAELIVLTIFLVVLMSSCAGEHYLCDAYASVEVENQMK